MKTSQIKTVKVSNKSNPASVAGSITHIIKETGEVEVQAVGAGAVNQAVKSIAVARGFLAPVGIDIISIPTFSDILIDGEKRTSIKFLVQPRN